MRKCQTHMHYTLHSLYSSLNTVLNYWDRIPKIYTHFCRSCLSQNHQSTVVSSCRRAVNTKTSYTRQPVEGQTVRLADCTWTVQDPQSCLSVHRCSCFGCLGRWNFELGLDLRHLTAQMLTFSGASILFFSVLGQLKFWWGWNFDEHITRSLLFAETYLTKLPRSRGIPESKLHDILFYLCQWGYVYSAFVRLSVCLSVSNFA